MTDKPLRPATADEIRQTLAYGLRFDTTGKAHGKAGELMAPIVAETLVKHLEMSGFVIMKKPPARPPRAG